MTLTDADWLAICATSESNRAIAWPYIMTVVRNRVEARGRFRDTYEEVVRQPWQFSHFNDTRNLTSEEAFQAALDSYPGAQFEEALAAAQMILALPAFALPLSPKTYYFWSPVSMDPPGSLPDWNFDNLRVFEIPSISPWRFRFAEEVSSKDPNGGRPV